MHTKHKIIQDSHVGISTVNRLLCDPLNFFPKRTCTVGHSSKLRSCYAQSLELRDTLSIITNVNKQFFQHDFIEQLMFHSMAVPQVHPTHSLLTDLFNSCQYFTITKTYKLL